MQNEFDISVVGGGIVGLSIAYGLLRKGRSVCLFDEGDTALRASRGNFGLIWVQGKGAKLPAYSRWTRESAKRWKNFAATLADDYGTDLCLQQRGGYSIFLTEQALAEKIAVCESLKEAMNGDYPFEVLGHNAIKKEEPHIGPKVAGAVLHHEDGHVNSLLLFRTLAMAVRKLGAQVNTESKVISIEPLSSGFAVSTAAGQQTRCEKVVLAAGLGTRTLGQSLGFSVPVRAQRGQVLITEKMPPILNRPSDEIRQVNEGGIQIGASAEEVGENDSETIPTTAQLAANAIKQYPILANASVVRSWGALRIMSADGFPIYQQSAECPGAYYATCHSGITLAAAHAQLLPDWICDDNSVTQLTDNIDLAVFSESRFHL